MASSTVDAVLPRANIVGRVPYKNAAIRLAAGFQGKSEEAQIGELKKAKFLFKVCKYSGYITLVLSRQARQCGFALRVVDRIDDSWARFTAGTVNGSGRDVPSDGVVPNERSNYPGLTGPTNLPAVDGATHVSIYRINSGVAQIERAMRLIRMEGARPSPPRRGDPPAALQAAVSGPTYLSVGEGGYWTAEVSGGTAPYTYTWGGSVSGVGPEIEWTFGQQGSKAIALAVTDAAGTTVNTGLQVFVSAGCGSQIECGMSAPGTDRIAPARTGAARLGRGGSVARAAQRSGSVSH